MNTNEIKKDFFNILLKNNSKLQNKNKPTNIKLVEDNNNFIFSENESIENKENENNNISIKKDLNLNFFQSNSNINKKKSIIKENLLNEVKYGIDENGNPMNINDYYKNINNKNENKRKRPIAYIIKDSNNDNILVDLNGNKIIEKNKEGDYEFPFQFKILIKDFDVKHPELRINGERIHSLEDDKMKNNNDNEVTIEKNNSNFKKEEIIDEISLQIDSTETEVTLPKSNKENLNCFYKRNIWNKKEIMNLWKLRYGTRSSNTNKINNSKLKLKPLIDVDSNKRISKHFSYHKSVNPTQQEIISRTNSILNYNKSVEDVLHTNNSQDNNVNSMEKNNSKDNIINNLKKDINNIYINKDYYNKNKCLFSPDININKTYYINSNKENFNNRIRNKIIASNISTKRKIINNINNCKKKFNNCLTCNFSNTNKCNTLSTLFTTPSSEIYRNKKKAIFEDFNYRINKSNIISYSNNNINNNNNHNRIKKDLINNHILIKINNKEKFENKNKNCLIIKKGKIKSHNFSSINNNNNKEKSIPKKNVKKRNVLVHSSIRSIEFSESSIIDYNNKENNFNQKENDNKISFKNKEIIKDNKISKLIKKIPKFPKKNNQGSTEKCSVLTKEANNMISNFLSKKNILINKKSILKKPFIKNENIINKEIQSYNKDKKNK